MRASLGNLAIFMWLFGILSIQAQPQKKIQKKEPISLDKNEIRTRAVRFQNQNSNPAPSYMREQDQNLGERLVNSLPSEIEKKTSPSQKKAKSNTDSQKEGTIENSLDTSGLRSGIAPTYDATIKKEIEGFTIKRIFNENQNKLGADLVLISNKTNLGHINRLQRVLAAYIEKNFQFEPTEARTASRFVLYYNAKNRGNVNVIKNRYDLEVLKNLDPQKIGIDRSYKNWAGKTTLLLPLRKNLVGREGKDLNLKVLRDAGAVSGAEKEALRDVEKKRNKVEVKKLKDKKINLGQAVKTSKERNEDLKRRAIDLQKAKLEKEKSLKELNKDPIKNAKAIQETEDEKRTIDAQKKKVDAEQAQEANKQKELQKQESEVAKQNQEALAEAAELEKNQDPNELKASTASEQNKEIEKLKEENKNLKEASTPKNVVQDKILFMRVVRFTKQGHYQNELWYLDANQDDAMIRSPYTNICSKDFSVLPGTGVVVTGYKGNIDSQTDHRLIMLSLDKLNSIKQSNALVYWRTPILVKNGKIYAFEEVNGSHYLTRFNEELQSEVRSKDKVNPNSDLTFYKDKIYLTGKSKDSDETTIHIMKVTDLNTLKIIDSDTLKKNENLNSPTEEN